MCVGRLDIHQRVLDIHGQVIEAHSGQKARRRDAAQRQPRADNRLTFLQKMLDRVLTHDCSPKS